MMRTRCIFSGSRCWRGRGGTTRSRRCSKPRRAGDPIMETHCALAFRQSGRLPEALSWLERAASREPVYGQALLELGVVLCAMQRYRRGRGRSCSADSSTIPTRSSCRWSWRRLHLPADPAKAQAAFARALRRRPDIRAPCTAPAPRCCSRASSRAPPNASARRSRVQPGHVRAQLDLAHGLLELGQRDEAVACLRTLVAVNAAALRQGVADPGVVGPRALLAQAERGRGGAAPRTAAQPTRSIRLTDEPPQQTLTFRCPPELEPILPKPMPAILGLPDWFKTMPAAAFSAAASRASSSTVKKCPPFIDAMTFGFLLPLACDLRVEDGTFSWDGSPPPARSRATRARRSIFTTTVQVAGTPYFADDRFIIKFNNFWTIESPPGYSLLITHPINRDDLPFTTLTGLVDADLYRDNFINFPAWWRDETFEGVLPKGTPVAQCIPVKRDLWDARVRDDHGRRRAPVAGDVGRGHQHARRLPPPVPRAEAIGCHGSDFVRSRKRASGDPVSEKDSSGSRFRGDERSRRSASTPCAAPPSPATATAAGRSPRRGRR